jgi:hypothetical protein
MSHPIALISYVGAAFLAGKDDAYRSTMAHYHLVQAVGDVESGMNHYAVGDGGSAVGAWQMHPGAWVDGNRQLKKEGQKMYPRGDYMNPKASRSVASAYLRLCGARLREAGISNPSPQQYYLCFAMGFQAFKEAGFDPARCPKYKVDAAIRVGHIFANATQ